MIDNRIETIFIAIMLNFSICLSALFLRQWLIDENITFILIIQSFAVLSLLVIHTFTWKKIGASDLSLAFIFFLMVFIFNLGKAILFVFYYQENASFFGFFTHDDLHTIIKAFEYGYVGLFVLSAAMLCSYQKEEKKFISLSQAQIAAARFTGLLFLAFSLPATLIDLKSMIVQVLSGGYFALFNNQQSYGAAGIIKVLTFFFYPSLLLLIAAYSKNKKILRVIFIFALSLALIKMALGMRLASLIPFIVLLSLWDTVIKPINRKYVYIITVFMFTVVFPALSFFRTGQEISEDIKNTSAIYRIIAEMSDSISPLIWVMQRVPTEIDFQYGHSFLLAITTIVPNLFWDVHPAKSGSLALWLVNEVNPWIAERGGGYGFSIFAELYLNFHWFGMLVLSAFAILMNKLAMAKKNTVNTAFAFACFLGFMLWPRGEIVTVARFIFWHVGILWGVYHMMVIVYHKMN